MASTAAMGEVRKLRTATGPAAGPGTCDHSSEHNRAERRVMSFPRRQFLLLSAAAAVLPAMSHVGWAQGYPTRQVRVIVPFAPGGPPDTVARLLGPPLSDRLGEGALTPRLPRRA